MLGDLVGEGQLGELLVRGRGLARLLEVRLDREVAVLDEEAAGELLDLVLVRGAGPRPVVAAGEQPHALAPLGLAGQQLERVVVEVRGDDRLDEAVPLHQEGRAGEVEGPGEGEDGPEGADRVAGPGALQRLGDGRPLGGAAGVRVLDDAHEGALELRRQRVRRVEVHEVVVGEGLPVQDLRVGRAGLGPGVGAVEGGLLVGVLAVAELHLLGAGDGEGAREGLLGLGVEVLLEEPGGDGGVVGRRAGEGALRQLAPEGVAEPPAVRGQLVEDPAVEVRLGHHRDEAVVLRRGADHGGAADVDLLDALVPRRALAGDGRLEGVEVDHHQVDRRDGVLVHGRGVLRVVADREQAAVDHRVEGLDPPVHHLREAGVVADLGDGDARLLEGAVRAPGGEQLHAVVGQLSGEVLEAALVGDGEQRAVDRS